MRFLKRPLNSLTGLNLILSAFFGCHVTVYLRNGFFLSFTGFYCVFFKEINRSVLGFTEFLFSFLLISLTRA